MCAADQPACADSAAAARNTAAAPKYPRARRAGSSEYLARPAPPANHRSRKPEPGAKKVAPAARGRAPIAASRADQPGAAPSAAQQHPDRSADQAHPWKMRVSHLIEAAQERDSTEASGAAAPPQCRGVSRRAPQPQPAAARREDAASKKRSQSSDITQAQSGALAARNASLLGSTGDSSQRSTDEDTCWQIDAAWQQQPVSMFVCPWPSKV